MASITRDAHWCAKEVEKMAKDIALVGVTGSGDFHGCGNTYRNGFEMAIEYGVFIGPPSQDP